MVQLKQQTYASYITERYDRESEGSLTDFISRQNGHLYLDGQVNLNELARRYGTPLEVVYLPLITKQIQQMQAWTTQARHNADYCGAFLYAYATKANFATEAVQTALAAGAHYETSAAIDVQIAHYLWRQGMLPNDRLILCNGSKEPAYLKAIQNLRLEGCTNIIPICDDLDEVMAFQSSAAPFQFGVRERMAGNRDGRHPGNDRFGLTADEIDQVVDYVAGTEHQLTLYHAMIGSQVEDREHFLAMLRDSVIAYCRLRQRVPTLHYFNFGGGMPTSAYKLDFDFDYAGFLTALMTEIRDLCAAYHVPMPDLIGEFGRYTVASHSLYLFEVGQVKAGQSGGPDWYLINGSLMVSLPDSLLVDNQQFIILPLDHWEATARPIRLAGRRTCDSDDVYPRPAQEPLVLPDSGVGLVIAVFGIGAYQQMISGRGGAHHCLSPEPRRVVISENAGQLRSQSIPQQDQAAIMRLLGYRPQRIAEPIEFPATTPARRTVQIPKTASLTASFRRRSRERLRLVRAR
ncbi:MAG: arginine decarboxylase [Chloroflexales bacterium]|nr:arginine decarboxylase [Chloroflexales bacterium]